MNDMKQRTMFIGTDLYYSQEYVDEIVEIANKYHDIIYKIEENCKWSIYSINETLTLNKICPFTKDGRILINKLQELKGSDSNE